jgi:hypothetical protein
MRASQIGLAWKEAKGGNSSKVCLHTGEKDLVKIKLSWILLNM